jgi:hypothetical protein
MTTERPMLVIGKDDPRQPPRIRFWLEPNGNGVMVVARHQDGKNYQRLVIFSMPRDDGQPINTTIKRIYDKPLCEVFYESAQQWVMLGSAFQDKWRQVADAVLLARTPSVNEEMLEALRGLEASASATLSALDEHNEKHGTFWVGPSFIQLGKSVAIARDALARATGEPL